jgi:hypothetical protein
MVEKGVTFVDDSSTRFIDGCYPTGFIRNARQRYGFVYSRRYHQGKRGHEE